MRRYYGEERSRLTKAEMARHQRRLAEMEHWTEADLLACIEDPPTRPVAHVVGTHLELLK